MKVGKGRGVRTASGKPRLLPKCHAIAQLLMPERRSIASRVVAR